MDSRIHITAKDLVAAHGYTEAHAQRKLREIKQELQVRVLTISRYCDYQVIDLDEFLTSINVKLPNHK